MAILSYITPINSRNIKNINCTEHVLVYMGEDLKIKRAIPDLNQDVMEFADSKIEDALHAEKLGVFRRVSNKEKVVTPVFGVLTDEDGTIVKYDVVGLTQDLKLENLLLGSEQRQKIVKLLQKTK